MRRSSPFLAFICAGALQLSACGSSPGNGTGAAGNGGAAGVAGAAGLAGSTAGAAGVAGSPGAAGSTGTAGQTGAAGNGGAAGVAGAAGATGAAGTTGVAGATAGTTGAAGAGGAGAAGAGGSTGVVKSAGCGKDIFESPTKWNQHNIVVTAVAPAYSAKFTNRVYWTRPPSGTYDNTRPYNLILWGQGCGQGPTPENIPPYENPHAWANSVIVELLASQMQPNHCYSAGPDGDSADSPEIPYFDQVVSEVEAEFCIDKSKVFEGGYSSGGWEASLMSCVRTNVLRGTGWAAAGLQKNHAPCAGPVAALVTIGVDDMGTPYGLNEAIASFQQRNGCATTSKPWMPVWNAGEEHADTSSCVIYDGCMQGYPLVYCRTPGGHTNTEGPNDTHLTRDGLWKLWSTL